MTRKPVIQKITALWLLIVFAVSAAPKAYFHDLLANHKDSAGCAQAHTRAALHQQGYHCHFDELVVTTPFLLQADACAVAPCIRPEARPSSLYTASIQSRPLHSENRGPPAC